MSENDDRKRLQEAERQERLRREQESQKRRHDLDNNRANRPDDAPPKNIWVKKKHGS